MKKRTVPFCLVSMMLLFAGVLFVLPGQTPASYPPPEFQKAMVFSLEVDGSAPITIFYAVISGPSPEDVASFTATGPSGTYTLSPRISFRQFGLYYACSSPEMVINGTYTFELKDSLGRTVSVIRNFVYNGALPQVDAAGMTPASLAYVGTTTPTLNFSPVAGDYLYEVSGHGYGRKSEVVRQWKRGGNHLFCRSRGTPSEQYGLQVGRAGMGS